MKCPNCGLFNPESAVRCDCGYDFKSNNVEASYIDGVKHINSSSPLRLLKRIVVAFVAFLLSGVFVAIWKSIIPPNMATGAIMALIAIGIIYGAWKWSAKFQ